MIFVRVQDGSIFSEDRLRSEFANVSFPAILSGTDVEHLGFEEIIFTDKPSENCYYTAEKQGDGRWYTVWHKSPDELQTDTKKIIIDVVQRRLDDYARSMGYDNILSACSYATSSVEKFRTEGQKCVQLRDATWQACFDLQSKVESGEVTPPSTEIIAWVFRHLPKLGE